MNNLYKKTFYENRDEMTIHSAKKILEIIKEIIINAKVLDLGCGVGTWAKVAKEMGAKEVRGLDGPWVDTNLIEIDQKEFSTLDLNKNTINFDKNFDLIIWLENIEHLSKGKGEEIINHITNHTDFVLFSGAIPDQGGKGHLNERWQSYWAEYFDKKGFKAFDVIRPKIWKDEYIPFWYKQNIVLYANSQSANKIFNQGKLELSYLDLVHPEIWNKKNQPLGIKRSFKMLLKAIKNKILF